VARGLVVVSRLRSFFFVLCAEMPAIITPFLRVANVP